MNAESIMNSETNTETRHFVLTKDGNIREFSSEQAASIVTGSNRLPEFADDDLRYLQVSWTPQSENELRVQTAGASIHFDANGRLSGAHPVAEPETISSFEHDTCVQWALREIAVEAPVFH